LKPSIKRSHAEIATKLKKVVTIIQARISSTRLPGKVLLPILGEPLLLKMIERVASAHLVGTVVVATSTADEDKAIVHLCEQNGIEFFRGSKLDLLDRHYQCALNHRADVVVKIPSDCPLIDPATIDEVLNTFLNSREEFDYVSNLHPATFPDGNDVEAMAFSALENAWVNAHSKMELEHTTPYIWENPDRFKIGNVTWEMGLDYSMSHRWTIDYPEDYQFINAVYEELYPVNKYFTINDILKLLMDKPELKEINKKWVGVNWYRDHLHELKTVSKEHTRRELVSGE
jgi:spore coat polysaccharide biosynthesis protein SpsF